MLDTIRVSIQNFNSEKFSKENGWERTKDFPIYDYKKIKLANKASIFMSYYSWSQTLVLHFSASKIQNGSNAIPYDFARYGIVENAIVKTVKDELGVTVKTKDMLVCRLDLNHDFVFENEEQVNAVMDFANKILPARYEQRYIFGNAFSSLTKKGNGFRVYCKHQDKHLKKSERLAMDPTIRFEFQMNRKAATRIFGFRPNLHQILTNQITIELVWNRLLDIYGLNKDIVTREELHRIAIENISQLALRETLKQMNDAPSFDDKEHRQKQLAVTRKFKSLGVCPYSCEIPLTMKKNVCNTIIRLRKAKRIWNNTANTRPYKSRTITRDIPRNTKWYLDSS